MKSKKNNHNKVRSLGGLASAGILLFSVGSNVSFAESPLSTSISLDYTCVFPLVGPQPINLEISSSMDSLLLPGESFGPNSFDVVANFQGQLGLGFDVVTASTLKGQATLTQLFTGNNVDLEPALLLNMEVQAITSTDGDFPMSLSGESAPLFFESHQAGDAELNIGELTFTLIAQKSDGTPVIYAESDSLSGEFPVSCDLNADQDTALHTFIVTADPTGVEADISLSPTEIDFGSVGTGINKTEVIQIQNVGENDLGINNIFLEGTDAASYIQSNSCTSLSFGESCEVEITLISDGVGVREAELVIESTDIDEATVRVPLTASISGNEIFLDKSHINFSGTQINGNSSDTFVIANIGSGQLDISSIFLVGEDSSSFSLTHNCAELLSEESCLVDVVFMPTTEGEKTASIVIESSDVQGTTAQLALSGMALPMQEGLVPVNLNIDYICLYPLIGNQPLNLDVNSEMPLVVSAEHFFGPLPVTADARLEGLTWTGLNIVSARTISGNATLSSELTADTGFSQTIPISLTFEQTSIPSSPSDITFPAQGSVIATQLNASLLGQVSVDINGLSMELLATKENGNPVFFQESDPETGIFPVGCFPIANQNLTLHSFAVRDSNTGIDPNINIAPSSFDFGDVKEGVTSAKTFLVTNSGDSVLEITNISIVGNEFGSFAQSNDCNSLEFAQSCTIEVFFGPEGNGLRNADIIVESNDPDEASVAIAVSGVSVGPAILFSRSSINFGLTPINSDRTQTVEIRNIGGGEIVINGISITGVNSDAFIEINDCDTLLADEICQIDISLNSDDEGVFHAELVIDSSDNDQPLETITLDGEVSGSHIEVNRKKIDFGTVPFGFDLTEIIIIKNAGATDLGITNILLTGPHADAYIETNDCNTLAQGQSCRVNVTYLAERDGNSIAHIDIESTDTDSPKVKVLLKGETEALSGSFVPASLNLDLMCSFPLVGVQPINLDIDSHMNSTLQIGESFGPYGVRMIADLQGFLWQGMSIVGAETIGGSASIAATIEGDSEGDSFSVDMPIDFNINQQTVPEEPGDFTIVAQTASTSIAIDNGTSGEFDVAIQTIQFEIVTVNSNDDPIIFAESDPVTGAFPVSCEIVAGQDTTLHTFNVESNATPLNFISDVMGETTLDSAENSVALVGTLTSVTDSNSGNYVVDLDLQPTEIVFTQIAMFSKVYATLDFESTGMGTFTSDEMTVESEMFVRLPKIVVSFFGFRIQLGGGDQCRTSGSLNLSLSSDAFSMESGGTLSGDYVLPTLENCGPLTSLLNRKLGGASNHMELNVSPSIEVN